MNARTWLTGLALLALAATARADGTRLLRHPSISDDSIAFTYANDIWVVDRDGGEARRLTSFQGSESNPQISPDGKWVAFTGQYDGNTDVYVVGIEGGSPKRLTWHPGGDGVVGWTPDGTKVIFASGRDTAPIPYPRFWTIGLDDAMPRPLPIPRGRKGKYSPDMTRFAYQMVQPWETEFRNYRGGQNRPIWVLDMDTYALSTLPWEGSNDTDPVWIGDTIYFLSDRDYAVNVYAYDTRSQKLEQLTHYAEYDVKNLDAGGGMLVYEYGGYIYTLDPKTRQSRQVPIVAHGDRSWARPHWENVGRQLSHGSLSPTGKRAVFEGRGEIFTVPAEKGDWRNLTKSSGAADRSPVWSPDGKSIAWFSDASGEYQLMIGTQDGLEPPRAIDLKDPTFYFTPAWSPDSKKILFTDEGLNLWYVDVESGEQVLVDTDQFAEPQRTVDPVWAPDSEWIAYAKRLDTHFHAIMVYSLSEGKSYQLTDGLSDAVSPAWDASGKYIYFLASTDFALNTGWLDMSSIGRPVDRAVYFAVLQADEPSPLLPESDEEEVKAEEKAPTPPADENAEAEAGEDEAAAPADAEGAQEAAGEAQEGEGAEKAEADEEAEDENAVRIDFDGIGQRILSIGVPSRNYVGLFAGAEGVVFYAESIDNQPGFTLHRYEFKSRKSEPFMSGVSSATISHDGKKILYNGGGSWGIVDAAGKASVGQGHIDTGSIRMKVDPPAEWRQIFDEAWRYERDFFYVDNLNGADWDKVYKMYSPWVEYVGHRSDLTHLLDILGGETSVGHSFTGGGDNPDVESIPIGLLGADFEIDADAGRYRIARIYDGENWNPNLRAPLRGPGLDIKVGDYILAVNGAPLTTAENLYSAFEATAGRQTVLHVSATPDMDDAREVTIVPVPSEFQLRQYAWVEDNRRKVDELSDGKLAYVWLPNTGFGGYSNFNRYYFAQQDKKGAVIDERFNQGGFAADYIVDLLSRDLQGFFNNPVAEHKPFTNPGAGIWGPKVMIINENAGSGGDLMPWMFKNMKIGPLVGTRTWGGLVGIWDVPPLIDGGSITAPRGGFYNMQGEWDVENKGVSPDIAVENTPAEVIAGHDPQLERAVQECLRLLEEKDWPHILPEPAPPIRVLRPDH